LLGVMIVEGLTHLAALEQDRLFFGAVLLKPKAATDRPAWPVTWCDRDQGNLPMQRFVVTFVSIIATFVRPHDQLPGWKGDFWKQLAPPNDPFTISRDKTPMLFDPGMKFEYSNPGIGTLTYA
jgi:hypothetical protein